MRSLRARLVAAVLVLCTLGLIVLGAVTYFEQRHFLIQRIDQQLARAPDQLSHALGDQGIGPVNRDAGRVGDPRRFPDGRPRPGSGFGPAFAGPPPGIPDRGVGGPRGGGGPQAAILPPGTWGQRRDSAGRVLGSTVISYGQAISANPRLPSHLVLNRIFTTHGQGSDHRSYRVLAAADASTGGIAVAAIPLTEVDQTLSRLLEVEGLVIAGVLFALGLASWLVVRAGLRPLDRIGETAGRIAGGDLSHRVRDTDPRTEAGRLGVALNLMLDRLEAAFREREASEERLRQFLADASHELRTPLAAIRGYAELHRMGATRDSESVQRSMGRIEDEAARMGVLVEDLLALARLDEVADQPHVLVDLAELARDAVDDARAVAQDRAISLRADGADLVSGQPDQLRQVLANLLRNAVTHTPQGSPIEVSVERDDGWVRARIRDHGPGLPDVAAEALFERFWRAEGGRERGRDGAGLGLAIVAGIVEAHRGRVEAANAPGGGAVFTVALPVG